MSNLRIWIGIIIFLVYPPVLKSQGNDKLLSLRAVENTLSSLMKQIYSDASLMTKEAANDHLIEILRRTIIDDAAFHYPFDSLKHIGRTKSEDNKVRIFSWNIPQTGGYQKYYGFILLNRDKEGLQLIELTDGRKWVLNPIDEVLDSKKWLGALYYSIIDVSYKGLKYYILLGLDFNNLFSSKKIIDVLTFTKDGKAIFGLNIFQVDDVSLNRVIFEYAARASMTLRYIHESKTIVFDHLSPIRPDFAGNFQFYGPDFTYDGFKFEDGKWVYVRDLDLRNTEREHAKPRVGPENFPDPGFLYKSKGGAPMQLKK